MKSSLITLNLKKHPAARITLTLPAEYRRWQAEMLKRLPGRRLALVVAHRRAGKTEGVCVRLIEAACFLNRPHPNPMFAYIAPYLNQAKAVAWERLKYYSRRLPRTLVNESELSLKLFNGAVIRLFGADSPDRLRGLGFDGVVMDEVAQMRPETWPEVVRPCLADRRGWAVFIGTPKGRQNSFFSLRQQALAEPDLWYVGVFPADQTKVISPDELKRLKAEMGDKLYRQEFLCDFSVAAEDGFLDYELVERAGKNQIPVEETTASPLVFGLDLARFGGDRTVLARRRGRLLEDLQSWRGLDLMQTSGRVAELINFFKPQAVFIDAVGLGAGVVDRLKQLGYRVTGVIAGAAAHNPRRYYNLRAEMWGRMRDWLLEGGTIPDRPDLKADLLSLRYTYDPLDRLRLEKKEDLKARGLPSPDCADALALTFAYPVAVSGARNRRPRFAEL